MRNIFTFSHMCYGEIIRYHYIKLPYLSIEIANCGSTFIFCVMYRLIALFVHLKKQIQVPRNIQHPLSRQVLQILYQWYLPCLRARINGLSTIFQANSKNRLPWFQRAFIERQCKISARRKSLWSKRLQIYFHTD